MEKPIYKAFEEFVKATFNISPDEFPAEQLQQLKMAFYGGALVVENLITKQITSGSEAAGAKIIFIIQNELIEFGEKISEP